MKKKEFKDRKLQNEFLARLDTCIKMFDEADKFFDELNDYIDNKLSEDCSMIDKERSDYLHLIEDYELSDAQMLKITKALEENADKRRNYHNMLALGSVWRTHKNKIHEKNNRGMLVREISNRVSNLDKEYNNRVIDDEQLEHFFDEPKEEKKIRRVRKYDDDIVNKIRSLRLKNISVIEISKKLDIPIPSIYQLLRTK